MRNLYEETKRVIEEEGFSLSDITFIGTARHRININSAIELMKKTEYDGGFGAQRVADNLIIIGNGFSMKRREYDGSEWWELEKTFTVLPSKEVEIDSFLAEIGWDTLEEINNIY